MKLTWQQLAIKILKDIPYERLGEEAQVYAGKGTGWYDITNVLPDDEDPSGQFFMETK